MQQVQCEVRCTYLFAARSLIHTHPEPESPIAGVADFQQATDILQQLRAPGVRIDLDDLGAGYSSLSYLAALPFDILKVDRSFITSLQPETPSFEIVRAIVQLASTLGKQVVAEGIETESEEGHLAGIGCTLLQGYRISRPLPIERAMTFVSDVQAGSSLRLNGITATAMTPALP